LLAARHSPVPLSLVEYSIWLAALQFSCTMHQGRNFFLHAKQSHSYNFESSICWSFILIINKCHSTTVCRGGVQGRRQLGKFAGGLEGQRQHDAKVMVVSLSWGRVIIGVRLVYRSSVCGFLLLIVMWRRWYKRRGAPSITLFQLSKMLLLIKGSLKLPNDLVNQRLMPTFR
jgi:hypothetical protein